MQMWTVLLTVAVFKVVFCWTALAESAISTAPCDVSMIIILYVMHSCSVVMQTKFNLLSIGVRNLSNN